jgi:peptidyl-dipeptidase A
MQRSGSGTEFRSGHGAIRAGVHEKSRVAPPVERDESQFDPGAKFHVAGNVPYTRYFLAYILEFQFYRAMCRASGYTGPLHRCTFFGSKPAGAKLNHMLEMGQSRPWPEALEALTGEKKMDAGAILEYFAPLKQWLDEQNEGKKVGW